MTDWIKFLGTGGARFVVSKQLRSTAGIWCSFEGCQILIDPGPGTLCRCFSSRPRLDPETLDAVILTHRHLDHSNDVNVILEAMTRGTLNRRGALFITADAVQGAEPVVFSHVRRAVERLELLAAGASYTLGNLHFSTPIRHRHPVETYGLVFSLSWGRVSFVIDTAYFRELEDCYHGSDLLILNVVFNRLLPGRPIQHLDLEGAARIIAAIRPRQAVMTHFGMTMLRQKPYLAAQKLTQETGVPVKVASDGMTINLEDIPHLGPVEPGGINDL